MLNIYNFNRGNRIQLKQQTSPSVVSAINLLRNEFECKKVLIELGQTMNAIYQQEEDDNNPVDCIVIFIMKGIVITK